MTDANRRGIVVAADIIPQSTSHRRASNRMLEALMVFYPGAFDYSPAQLTGLLAGCGAHARKSLKSVQFFNNDKRDVVIVRALTQKNEGRVGKSIAELAQCRGQGRRTITTST